MKKRELASGERMFQKLKPRVDEGITAGPKTVPELLRAGAATYEERQKSYGDNYKHFGTVMSGLFPNGLTIKSKTAWDRLGLIQNCVYKLGRYCNDIEKGHPDSAHDMSVYAAMLEEMTGE